MNNIHLHSGRGSHTQKAAESEDDPCTLGYLSSVQGEEGFTVFCGIYNDIIVLFSYGLSLLMGKYIITLHSHP